MYARVTPQSTPTGTLISPAHPEATNYRYSVSQGYVVALSS